MKLLRYSLIIWIIISILSIAGCQVKEDNENAAKEDHITLIDSIINEEVGNENTITLEELKSILASSNSIEVKNIDNQIIGKINTGEKINKVILDLFKLNAISNYEYSSDENISGIINFYPSGSDPIYGIVKEKFIYIEGYYFISKNNGINKIIDYFNTNTEEEPIVFDE